MERTGTRSLVDGMCFRGRLRHRSAVGEASNGRSGLASTGRLVRPRRRRRRPRQVGPFLLISSSRRWTGRKLAGLIRGTANRRVARSWSNDNFQRWISWLVHRWRTQRTAIRSVNCRTRRIIESLNANGAVGFSSAACLSECRPVTSATTARPPTRADAVALRRLGACDSSSSPSPCQIGSATPACRRRVAWPCEPARLCVRRGLCRPRRGAIVRARRRVGATSSLPLWPQIRQDHPLNLSISISGGRETNRDSLSNGEWSGNSSSRQSPASGRRIVVSRSAIRAAVGGPSCLERHIAEGENPVSGRGPRATRHFPRVGLFGNAAQSGW